jgi:modulator of FtsH protease HflK
MRTEPGDFGPIYVKAEDLRSWFRRLRGEKKSPVDPVAPEPPHPNSEEGPLVLAAKARVDDGATSTQAPRRELPSVHAPALPRLRVHSIVATLVLIVAVWLVSGFYKVQPDQVGVVLRFGRWVDTRQAGLNYHWPYPIESVLLPKVTAVNEVKIGNGAPMQMLTGDENIVEATASISWRIKDPGKYLFNVADPEGTVKVAGESAVRQIIGLNPIQSGLSDQRQKIADDAQTLLQHVLDSYDAGITVLQVQLQRVDPPLAVIDAFNDVQRARADQQRARNEAEAYRNDILPRARAEADRLAQDADAYREQALNQAHADADRFSAYATAYAQAPDITGRRLYLDTMEEVLKSAGKILIDPSGRAGPSIIPYLPLTPGTSAQTPTAPAAKATP